MKRSIRKSIDPGTSFFERTRDKRKTAEPRRKAPNPSQSEVLVRYFIGDRIPHWVSYGFAIVATSITLWLRLAFGFTPGDAPIVVLFTAPVFFSAFTGGLGPGLTATVLSALFSNYFLMQPVGTVHLPLGINSIQWWGLVLTGIVISTLSEGLHRSVRKIEAARVLQSVTLEGIGDGLITTDESGRVTFLNAEAERLTGWSSQEAAGQSSGSFFIPADEGSDEREDPVRQVLASGKALRLSEEMILRRDLRKIPVEYICSPITTDGEKIRGAALVFRDISERKNNEARLAAAESTFRALVEQSLAGIYIIQDGHYRYVNPGFASMFGYDSPEEIVGKIPARDLVRPEDREMVEENIRLRMLGKQKSIHYSFRGLRKDGRQIDVEVHGSVTIFNGEGAVIGLLLDVTERKALESALLDQQQHLEDLVDERTNDLNRALGEIKRSEERYRVLFTNSKIPMLLIDPEDGSIVEGNATACSYYGYSHEQLSRLKIHEINGLSPEEMNSEMQRARAENRNHFYFAHRLASGEIRDVEVHSGRVEIAGRKLLYSIVHDITERRIAERGLKELNRDFLILLENTSDFIYFKDQNGRIRFCSRALARITGHENWHELIGKHDQEIFPVDTASIYYEEELPIFREGKCLLNQVDPYYDENGNTGWVSTNKWPVLAEDGRTVVGLFGISRDITAQHAAEERLEIAASVFHNASEGILITDAAGMIIEANGAFSKITGYSREEVIGQNPRLLKSGHHDASFYAAMWKSIIESGFWQGEIWNRRKDGGLFACRTAISVVRNREGEAYRFIGLHSDVTEFIRHHEEIEHMAYYDALTQLPNRTLLADRMTQAIALADHNSTAIAVCYLDLDGFKPVNDQFGHKTGDLLLIETAKRLKACVRAEDTVARLGGDEFVLLLTNLKDAKEWQNVIERVLVAVREPYPVPRGGCVSVSASIGISLYPQDRGNAEQLLRHADLAMYEAKEEGRNQSQLYRNGNNLEATEPA